MCVSCANGYISTCVPKYKYMCWGVEDREGDVCLCVNSLVRKKIHKITDVIGEYFSGSQKEHPAKLDVANFYAPRSR